MIPLNFSNLLERVCGPNTQTPLLHSKLKSVGLAALLLFLLPIVGSAQCLDCSLADINPGATPDLVVECEGDIGDAEDYLIVNPACPVGSIAVADVLSGGDGSNGNPQTITRTYTYDPGNGDPTESCVQVIEVESQSVDPLDITCPADMIINLDAGQCEQYISYNVTATGQCATVAYVSGIESGEAFPLGISVQEYEATDVFGATVTCTFSVEVIEYDGDVDNLSCKADINVSVGDDCMARITPGMALSGDYLCYDNYTVTVSGLTPPGAITGNGTSEVIIDASMLDDFLVNGMTGEFDIMVSDGTTSCWNDGWMIEDKSPPQICCTDYTVNCIAAANPDNLVNGTRTWPATVLPLTGVDPLAPATFGVLDIPIEVDACENINLSAISVFLNIEHEQIGDLVVQLISPSGTAGLLFDRPGVPATASGCAGVDVQNWFVNGGAQDHSELEDNCTTDFDPEESQAINAATTISALFNGEPIAGTWTLRVIDLNENALLATVNTVNLQISGNYGEPLVTENCSENLTYTDEFSQEGCSPFQTITRTWIANDAKSADTCVQIITVARISINSIVCPGDFVGDDALACNGTWPVDDSYPADGYDHPHPSEPGGTGEPNVGGVSVDGFCMFDRSYVDQVFPSCGEAYDILRTWTIIDWCTGATRTCIQNIKIMDLVDPEIECPADMNVDAGNNCDAGVILPAPTTLSDNCSSTGPIYTISASAGTLVVAGGNNILSGLPLGTHTVTYTAEDDCGNTATCDFTITVADNDPPPCIGITSTTLGIVGSGTTIPWTSFVSTTDLSNVDNCGPVTVLVRRLDMDHCTDDESSPFALSVPFYCCDVENTVDVEVQVTDQFGQSNTCIVSTDVYDNISPSITCPVDKNISCDGYLTALTNYDGVTLDADGTPDDGEDKLTYTVIPNTAGTDNDTTFIGYYPGAGDNCYVSVYIKTADYAVDECGNSTNLTGTMNAPIKRTYTAVDASGNTSACTQEITIYNDDLFDPNTDIQWPDAEVTVSCSASASTGVPILTATEGCDNVHFYPVDTPPIATSDPDICHKVIRTWTVTDKCASPNNVYTFVQTIKVSDNQGPTLDCFDAQSIVQGNDLDASATVTDNCTPIDDIMISYAIDQGNDGGTPEESGSGSLGMQATGAGTFFPVGEHAVTYTASDDCGNTSTCSVVVIVTSNIPPMSNVAGAIGNEENGMLVDVEVSPGQGMDVVMTDDNGEFNMNLPTLENYNVTPVKDNDHLNGVSTYDIVLISKHLLNIELLDSPYKMIAADINKSDHISTLDMLQLRKVILFIDDEFQSNTSWRFVDAGYLFNDPTNPFGETFPESYPINGLEDNMADIDFVAVKTGDVNGTASTGGFAGGGEDRTYEGDLKLRMQDQSMKTDRTYFVDVKSSDFNEILGYQFTLGFDEDAVEIVDVVGADLPGLDASNFNLQRTAEGAITTSWNQQTALSLEDNTVLFTLEVRAKQDVALSEVLNVSSRLTAAEAYQENGVDVDLMNIAFEYEDAEGEVQASNFELYQNRPNPFKNETMISFRLPEAGKASLKVYDISGKVLKLINGSFEKGYNELNLDRAELNGSGVLYYELSTANHTAIQKMIVID